MPKDKGSRCQGILAPAGPPSPNVQINEQILVWCTGSPWIVCNRCSQRESGWPWMTTNSVNVWSSSPRPDILGHSQPSLRDWSRGEYLPRTDVLGYSQPVLSKLVFCGGSTHPSAKTLHGSVNRHFVIPRSSRLAEGELKEK
jgi:hypothetical protein